MADYLQQEIYDLDSIFDIPQINNKEVYQLDENVVDTLSSRRSKQRLSKGTQERYKSII